MGYERNGGRDEQHRDRYQGDRHPNDRGYRPSQSYRAEPYRGRDDYRDTRDYAGRQPPRDYDYDDRGFLDRAGDEVRSWFGDEEAERRRRWDERVQQREYERRYGRSDRAYPPSATYGSVYDPLIGGMTPFDTGLGAIYGIGRDDHPDTGRDPSYRAWRDRQISALDRDYDDYRRENQTRFDNDFGSWRSTREGQRSSLRQAREQQEVVGSDGQHVGIVDHVRDDRILLTRTDKDAGGHHHSIPAAWIVKVGDKVEINRTAAQAQAAWKDEDGRDGPRNLNRAFSGTY